MARYKLQDNGVYDNDNSRSIPESMANRHWVEYQDWLTEGNTPDPQHTLPEAQAVALDNVRQQASQHITATWPLWKQQNADAGIYPASEKTQKDKDVAATIAESNRVEDLIDAAVDTDAVDTAVASLNLPTYPVA